MDVAPGSCVLGHDGRGFPGRPGHRVVRKRVEVDMVTLLCQGVTSSAPGRGLEMSKEAVKAATAFEDLLDHAMQPAWVEQSL